MKQMRWILITLVGGLIGITSLIADESVGFQASLTPGIAVHPPETHVNGFALSVWGNNPQSAFALGFINGSSGDSSGLSLGLVNYADNYRGVHWSLVNATTGDFSGWQGGPALGLAGSVLNYVGGTMSGFQCGIVNLCGELSGLQLGVFNYTQSSSSGLQIGLINIITSNQTWFEKLPEELAPAMILANWSF